MNTIAIVMPYFGKFPNYFPLWLTSCAHNPTIDWLIFTDDKFEYNYPENVKVVYKSFAEIVTMFQDNFDFEIILPEPYKLCDYKPTYGEVFSDYLQKYDYWGFGDLDLIFGDIRSFLNYEILNSHDKILTHGSFCILKNTKQNNSIYRKEINGKLKFKEVYTDIKNRGFDEYGKEAFNSICMNENLKIYTNNLIFADIDSWKKHFKLTGVLDLCDHNEKKELEWEKKEEKHNSIFAFEKGKLFRYFIKNNQISKKEYLYVHFQKRFMICDKWQDLGNDFLMIPNKFVEYTGNVDKSYLDKYGKKLFFSNRRIKRQLYITIRMFLKNKVGF